MRGKWMAIVWPAFLMACVLEILVFAMVDPQDIRWLGLPLELPSKGVYTLVFFTFWAVTLVSSGLTAVLSMSTSEVNR